MAESDSTAGPDPAIRSRIEAQRRQLQQASAVLAGAALVAEYGDREVVADAITVARGLVDDAIAALDSVQLSKPTQE